VVAISSMPNRSNSGVDRVVIQVRGRGFEADVDPECLGEHPVEPHPRGRAAKQGVVLREDSPDFPRIGFRDAAVDRRYAERVELHALAVEHAEDVVIGDDQQRGGIAECLVPREPCWIGMAVRTDDRQVLDARMQCAGDVAGAAVAGEQAVGVKA
jgi:hypothetical protein